jgi:hypothetical protein
MSFSLKGQIKENAMLNEISDVHLGACRCGKVQFEVCGPPRVGLCHCTDCRKESGSVFVTFGVWPRSAFACTGTFQTYEGRSFCPQCGSRLFCVNTEEAEIRLGSLNEAPLPFGPEYELWIKRRETWLPRLSEVVQYDQDR